MPHLSGGWIILAKETNRDVNKFVHMEKRVRLKATLSNLSPGVYRESG
jgi:hypothetical protein